MKDRDLVDALILQHEADRLGMPAGPEMGREWLKQITGGRMNRELFEALFSRFSNEVSEEQILPDIANQVRLRKVRHLLGSPVVTPSTSSAPTATRTSGSAPRSSRSPSIGSSPRSPSRPRADVQALYDKYKDVLPDPARDTPGFKVPRQVQVEILSIDGNALARGIKDKLTESRAPRLTTKITSRSSRSPPNCPEDLFARPARPDARRILQPFSEVKAFLAPRLAEEKAQAEILDKFTKIREDELIPFADKYLSALDEQEEAKKQGATRERRMPDVPDLKPVAQREGLNHEISPLLSREQAERYGQISTAEVGLTRLSGGRKFAEEFFDPKTGLYEPVELTDILGPRFLARKIKDEPPRVPRSTRSAPRWPSPGRWRRPVPWPRRPPRTSPPAQGRGARSRRPRSTAIA